MKIKIVIASYADWVIIAALAVFLCVAAFQSFLMKDTKLDELKTEIDGYERKIKQRLTSAEILPMPKTDYVAALKDRFEHMPVISPFSRNPFLPPKEILYPLTQLREKASREIKLPGVRLMEQVSPVEEVSVKFGYNADEDFSRLTITAVHSGEVTLRMRDDMDQVFRFPIRIRPVPQLPTPLPPAGTPVILSRGPFDRPMPDRTFRREPGAVLIFFRPDNPSPMPMNVGNTTAAEIYRKPADSPDTVWMKAHKAEMLTLSTPEQRRAILEKFQLDKRAKADATPVRPPARSSGPVTAVEAPEMPGGAQAPSAEGTPGALTEIPPNTYVFLDEDVEEGESYLYRVVTVSTAEDAVPSRCKEPYVTPTPILIPSLVQMTLVSVTPRYARIRLSRQDPDSGETVAEEINVAAGMRIGGKIRRKVPDGVDVRGNPRVKDVTVDFSTGCVLVDFAPKFREIAYRLPLSLDRAGRPQFRLTRSEEPRIFYLTPRGYLRMKTKDEAPEASSVGGVSGAPMPPGAFGR